GNRILIYDVAGTNLTMLHEQTAHRDVVRALAWNTNNTRLASGSFREITVWEVTNMQPAWSAATNIAGRVTGLEFVADKLLAADCPPAQASWLRFYAADTGVPLTARQAHADSINALAVSPGRKLFATAGNEGLVKIWDTESQ